MSDLTVRITRRVLMIIVCISALLWCALTQAYAASGSYSDDYLTVGVPADRCPVFYIDPDTDEITGIGVDLMRAAAEKAGYTVSFTVLKEETLKDALDNDEYDIVMPFGSAVDSASGRKTIVTDNLIKTPFTLVTESRDKELPPLNELRVGMLSSLSAGAETVRERYPGMEIILYETMPESVEALRDGEVDALLHNSFVWSYVLQKPSYSDLAVQPEAMFSMDFRAGTPDTPEGRQIVSRLNMGIGKLTDTRRQAIILDHTSRRLYRYTLSDYIHEYGLFLILIALLFAALVIIALQKLRSVRAEHEEQMRQIVDHDQLTGVLSMSGFRKRVEQLLRAHPDIPYFISYNNITNFKYVNDSLGMASGDELLKFWADKTRAVLSDREAVGRIEGDHFVILREIGGDDKMLYDDRNVIEPVRTYFTDRGRENRVQICSGVYVLVQDDYSHINVDHMLDFARVAERRVREIRGDGYEFYNPEEWEKGRQVADVVGHLPVALQSGELQVFYQPQVDYETGDMTGTEALCRWKHDKLGWLKPCEFIPTLEEAGLIYDMDCFVWDRVCQDLHIWNERGKHLSVSVNLSRRDITADRNIPGHFYDLIQSYGLTVDQLRIEITETAFVENPELLIRTTRKLREFGFQVEMDDFGSGYSSLHMLKEVPVDRIKLDLHFLTGTGDVEKSRIIISHMIQMISDLGMSMIAEGVENDAQARFLMSRGCREMQGFYFYKPMPVDEFEEIIFRAEKPQEQ
ncbi:MAG: EAL domain-containing protein [Eubacterium sp.]|nr:EAL domain-containing protein [Eubacterium sp.]